MPRRGSISIRSPLSAAGAHGPRSCAILRRQRSLLWPGEPAPPSSLFSRSPSDAFPRRVTAYLRSRFPSLPRVFPIPLAFRADVAQQLSPDGSLFCAIAAAHQPGSAPCILARAPGVAVTAAAGTGRPRTASRGPARSASAASQGDSLFRLCRVHTPQETGGNRCLLDVAVAASVVQATHLHGQSSGSCDT